MHNWIFVFAIIVLCSGLFIMLTSDNYVRKVIGLGMFQASVLIFYIALAKVSAGILPINIASTLGSHPYTYSSPLPHILMLTAIVVGFATSAVAFALIKQIKQNYGTVFESEITDCGDNSSSDGE